MNLEYLYQNTDLYNIIAIMFIEWTIKKHLSSMYNEVVSGQFKAFLFFFKRKFCTQKKAKNASTMYTMELVGDK